jgi:CRP-like cAMP-binding protein
VADSTVDALRRVPLLADLELDDLANLGEHFRAHTFPAGAVIVHEGERGARILAFFIIASGTADVTVGGEHKATLGVGDHFGEIGLFHDVPRNATVTAETELACLALGAWEFRPFVEAHPSVAWKLLETMSQRTAESLPSG